MRLRAHATLKHDKMPGDPREAGREVVEVFLALGQQDRRVPVFERANHVVQDHLVAQLVPREGGVDLLDPRHSLRSRHTERGLPHDEAVHERPPPCLRLGIDREASR